MTPPTQEEGGRSQIPNFLWSAPQVLYTLHLHTTKVRQVQQDSSPPKPNSLQDQLNAPTLGYKPMSQSSAKILFAWEYINNYSGSYVGCVGLYRTFCLQHTPQYPVFVVRGARKREWIRESDWKEIEKSRVTKREKKTSD